MQLRDGRKAVEVDREMEVKRQTEEERMRSKVSGQGLHMERRDEESRKAESKMTGHEGKETGDAEMGR